MPLYVRKPSTTGEIEREEKRKTERERNECEEKMIHKIVASISSHTHRYINPLSLSLSDENRQPKSVSVFGRVLRPIQEGVPGCPGTSPWIKASAGDEGVERIHRGPSPHPSELNVLDDIDRIHPDTGEGGDLQGGSGRRGQVVHPVPLQGP